MSLKQIPEALRVARRALEIISSIRILQDWRWNESIMQWVLHCEISIDAVEQSRVPRITEWYVLVSPKYPWGSIEFYPSKKNGLSCTFPHQSFNSEGNTRLPWRDGNLCLSTGIQALGRVDWDVEPYDSYSRLYWRFTRAMEWLNAASQANLLQVGDYYELPVFPREGVATLVFSEGVDSFTQWQQVPDSAGFLDLVPLGQDASTLFVRSFNSVRGKKLLAPSWGKVMTEAKDEKVAGIWIRLNQPPVLEPWQAPSNWGELRKVCREQEIVLDEQLGKLVYSIRDAKEHLLLLGFPIPSKIGDLPCQLQWQALRLPVLSYATRTADGFRTNEQGYWQRDRFKLLKSSISLSWVKSENWHSDQISTRGRFRQTVADKNVLLIGVGAIGSIVAELLVRGNVHRITLVDPDNFEIGNISRHTLDRDSLQMNKAERVAKHLNLVSPQATIDAIASNFSSVATDYPEQFDVIVDCTGSDHTLYSLNDFPWRSEKTFVSISLGRGGKRLFCFTAFGGCFPCSTFNSKIKYWLQKEYDEFSDQPLPWAGIGCWHPVFPARVDDVWMMASVAVKHFEPLIGRNLVDGDLAVFEQMYDVHGNFCSVQKVDG